MKQLFALLILVFEFTNSFAQQGESLNFDYNANTAVQLSNNIQLTGSFTIEAWIFPIMKSDFATIIGNKSPGISSAGYFLAINNYGSTDAKIVFETQNTSAQSSLPINWSTWQHIAVTYNGNGLKMYLDGTAFTVVDSTAINLQSTANPCYLGDIPAYLGNGNYNGNLDELRIWNYERSESEIQSAMLCQLPLNQNGLMAYYQFNEGIANGTNGGVTTLPDLSGNNNNGALLNFTLSGTTGNWTAPGGVANITNVQTLTPCAGTQVIIGNNTYITDGIYVDTLFAGNGCDSIVTSSITFQPAINFSQNVSLCEGDTLMVGAFMHDTSGVLTDTLMAGNGCDSVVTTTITLDIIDTLVIQIGAALIANQFATSYQWVNCDSALSPVVGETNQTFNVTSNGIYAVIITLGNCTATSSCFTVIVDGINEDDIRRLNIQPNPATDFILAQNLPAHAVYSITTIEGVIVKEGDLLNATEKINIADLNNGIYFFRVNSIKPALFIKQ